MKCNCRSTNSYDRCSCYQKGYVDSAKEHKVYMDDCQKRIRLKNAELRKLKSSIEEMKEFILEETGEHYYYEDGE